MSAQSSKERLADSAARDEAWHSFANSEPAPTHRDCFRAGWVYGKGYARSAVETPAEPVSNWNPSRVRDGWDCWTCGAFVTHKQDAADIEKDCLKPGCRSAVKTTPETPTC